MTRADQWAAVWRGLLAILVIGAITVAATVDALRIGAAAAGLLYLLPVLWASARAGLNAGLASAAAAAFCYNFFLLEPRYTLRIHGPGDAAAFLVLTIAAVVTSRLASDLRARETEARRRAETSEAEAALAAKLARAHDRGSLDAAALDFFARSFGDAHLVRGDDLAAKRTGLSPLDAAAAAWALHHGSLSGRATEVMPSADFRFVPLGRGSEDVLAVAARQSEGVGADDAAIGLARVWAQARDRSTVEAERQAREEAEARDAVRRTLLAALGHDFRTPLTVLKSGLAELDGEPAARLGREVDRLVRLTDDLLASARLEGGAPVALEAVDLVDAVASALPPGESEQGATVRTAVPDDLPLVRADPVMLAHLLGNLLDNAVRRARSEVALEAREEEGRVRVDVRDDGEGLDPAIADTVFGRFAAGADRDGCSGLGLAIARDLADAMGAELSVANDPAGGACFTLLIDAVAPSADAAS